MSLKYVGKDQYISLITKQLNNELSTSELRELNNWLSASSGNSNLVSEFKNVWNAVSSYKGDTVFNVDTAYADFLTKYDIAGSTSTGPVSKSNNSPINRGISGLRLFFAALTTLALIYGGVKLSAKIKNSISNDTMAAITVPLSPLSTATIAPSSSLNFNKDNFSLSKLNGQVFLELDEAKGSQPLRLNLDDISANANNATLNLQRFKKDKSLVADIAQGTVIFQVNDEKIVLEEGKRLVYSEKDKKHKVIDSDNAVFEWKKGVLSFDNTPLKEVFESLEKFYGVNITVKGDIPQKAHFTAMNLKPSKLNDCLELLASSIDMQIDRKGLKEIEISNIKAK